MPTAHFDGVEIHYEIVGEAGPQVAVFPSGRHSLGDLEEMARHIAARGFRVILHDRRNCGVSSISFDRSEPEEDVWADDLHRLLDHLDWGPVLVAGKSRGARTAIRFAERHPGATRGLLLWGITGGPVAGRVLANYYYGRYLRACRDGGMEAVCEVDHFARLIDHKPANRDVLMAMDPIRFRNVMRGWRAAFLHGDGWPVLGVSDDRLGRIAVPTAVVPFKGRCHPHTSAEHAARTIPNGRLFDLSEDRQESGSEVAVAEIFCDFAGAVL